MPNKMDHFKLTAWSDLIVRNEICLNSDCNTGHKYLMSNKQEHVFIYNNCFCTSLQGTGKLLWEHDFKDPITSSAYVDENIQIVSDPSHLSER